MTLQNFNLYTSNDLPYASYPIQTMDKVKGDPKEKSKLQKAEIKAHRILFRAKAVFPFDLFPDEIVIDENKVDLVYGIFFFSRQVISVSINDLNGAISVTNLFFGSLQLEIRGYDHNPLPIRYLWNHEAERARRIINGLVACWKQQIDTSSLNLKSALAKIENIGSALQS